MFFFFYSLDDTFTPCRYKREKVSRKRGKEEISMFSFVRRACIKIRGKSNIRFENADKDR